MTKEDKIMLVTLILVLFFVLVFLSIEILEKFQKVSEEAETITTTSLDSLYNIINSLPKNEDPSTIRRTLNEIFELMNEKEYDKLYELLADDFKKMYFPTVESLKNQLDETFNDTKYSPSFLSYEKFGNIYVVAVSYIPKKVNDSDITSQEIESLSDTFSIIVNDDGSYKFSFLGYIAGISPNTKKGDDKISIELTKVHLYNSKTIFEIKIHNNTEESLVIDKEKIYSIVGVRPVYYPSTVIVPKNSSKTINFTIYTGLSLNISLPTHIYFQEIITNEKIYMCSLPITYPIDF